MALLPSPFNAHTVEPAGPAVSQLPISGSDGWPVIVSASEFKASKSGNGTNGYLELTLSIIEGEHKGQTGAYRLNLFNENAQTVDIASRQLSAICHVTGQMMISDSAQLHNIPFRAVVGLQKKAKEDAPDYTEVKGVLDYSGNRPGQAKPAQAASAPVPAFAGTPAAAPAPQAPAFTQPQAQQAAPAAAPWGQQAAPAQTQEAAPSGAPVPPWATR